MLKSAQMDQQHAHLTQLTMGLGSAVDHPDQFQGHASHSWTLCKPTPWLGQGSARVREEASQRNRDP